MASWERLVEAGAELGPDPELAGLDTGELIEQVRGGAVAIAAETARWIVLVAELVVRGAWADEGARTPGAWLSWSVGMAPSTAREHVRVGLALRTLPKVRARFLEGRISYSKVRAITRLGHRETEDVLLAWADAAPAAELDRIVTSTRRSAEVAGIPADPFGEVDPADASDERARVERVAWRMCEGDARELRVQMDEIDGARMQANLEWLARQQDPALPASARMVAALDAALTLAMDRAPSDTSGLDRDRLLVEARVVPASGDESAPAEAVGAVPIASNETAPAGAVSTAPPPAPRQLTLVPRPISGRTPAMSVRSLRRLACTASIVPVVIDHDDQPLDVGRAQRTATAKQRRALRMRDPVCRFPGCQASRHLDAHHAIEWDDGGRTDLDNLLHLCGFHHRFVHRSNWQVEPLGRGRFTFLDATGRTIPERTPAPDVSQSAPAEAVERRAAPADPHALQPPWWDGAPVDYGLCVEVLLHELERRHPTTGPSASSPDPARVAA